MTINLEDDKRRIYGIEGRGLFLHRQRLEHGREL